MQKCQNETKAVLKLFPVNFSTSKVVCKCQEKMFQSIFCRCLIAWLNASAAKKTRPNQFANPIFGLSWVKSSG